MLSGKNSQNVPKYLAFLEIAILSTAGTEILCVFNQLTTFHKHFEASVFDKFF